MPAAPAPMTATSKAALLVFRGSTIEFGGYCGPCPCAPAGLLVPEAAEFICRA
jgi:hypothetical protein